LTPEEIEDAINKFETTSSDTFRTYRMIPPISNLDKERIDLLQQVKKERKCIISATDKNLGPAIMEIDQYIERALKYHLDHTETYRELVEEEAILLNKANFRWICHEFIDFPPVELSKKDRKYFFKTLCGFKDTDSVTLIKKQYSFHISTFFQKYIRNPNGRHVQL
jgi:SAM-dependent MidA family methyltransferase